MRRGGELWANGPTNREMAILLAAALAALALRHLVLGPVFAHAVGFLPFDLQPRLNRGMLVIQLGATRAHEVLSLYSTFAVADILIAIVVVTFTLLFWRWLFLKAPNPVFTFLTAGGIVLLPLTTAGLEIAEHGAVWRLLARSRADYADAMDLVISLHNLKVALADVRDGLTGLLTVIGLGLWALRRKAA